MREDFDGHLDPSEALIRVDDCKSLTDTELEQVAATFNRYGFVVVEHVDPGPDPGEQVVALGRYLGSTYVHNRADERGIVLMAPTDPSGVYLGASNREHPLHTDGAYDARPPPLLALQCVVAASTGGLSTAASGHAIHRHVADRDPGAFQALHREDALRVERADQMNSMPVFRESTDGCTVVWRNDHTSTFAKDADTRRAVDLITSYLSSGDHMLTFLLKPCQILLLDNTAVLHGRTAFSQNDTRLLNRINFLGDTAFARDVLEFGFDH